MKDISFKFVKLNFPVFICFIIIVCIILHQIENRNQLSTMKKIGYQVTYQTAAALENWVEDQIKILKTIAHDKRVIEACKNPENIEKVNEAYEVVKSFHEQFDYYENLPLASKMLPDKSIEISVNGEIRKVGDGQFFTDTVKGKTIGKGGPHLSFIKAIYEKKDCFISEVYPSLLRGNPLFVISTPVKNKAGNIIGVSFVSPQMNYFTDFFVNEIKIGETGYMFFIDNRGMLISHPDKKLILKSEIVEKLKPITSNILSGKTEFKSEYEGVEKYYIAHKISIKGTETANEWYIVFAQSSEEIFKSEVFSHKIIVSGLIMIFIYIVPDRKVPKKTK